MTGRAEVIAAIELVSRLSMVLPDFSMHESGHRYQQLIAMTWGLARICTAAIHTVDAASLAGSKLPGLA